MKAVHNMELDNEIKSALVIAHVKLQNESSSQQKGFNKNS
ncbi:hypothetical protein KAOT1_02382 [Kordia algicida OT-1]|uniref:Uncharacterized protein n=1 Tax=Kordia algicida OT-1 TaxID=391587 RepID=A9DTP9_9FLAO|nr:hypothetical protein KAOT1_02382 [Kordia algicida OT-1]